MSGSACYVLRDCDGEIGLRAAMISNSMNSLSLEELIGRRDPPPLRIHHIMVATAVVAALLSVNYTLRQSNSQGLSSFASSGFGNVLAITTGIAATLVGFGFAWRRAGFSFLDLPGHWLLLVQSLPIGFFAMMGAIGALQLPDNHALTRVATGVVFGSFHLLNIGLNLWAARRIADSIPWTLIFLIDGLRFVALFGIVWLGFHALLWIAVGGALATLILLLLACWGDHRDHIHRDWPQWLGVALRIVPIVQALGQPVWAWTAGSLFT
jgi:hypothetical protein